MNLKDLIHSTRILADDAAGAELWSDEDIIRYLNEAEAQASIRARLLQEIGNPTYCQIALTEGGRQYSLNPLVWEVNAARRRGATCSLNRTGIENLRFPDTNSGHPTSYALFGQANAYAGLKLMLDIPAFEGGFLDMDVYRLPAMPMQAMADEPEISEFHQQFLPHWALHRMYSHRDIDAEDQSRSATHLGLFEARFGVLPDANVARKRLRHQPPIVRPTRYP